MSVIVAEWLFRHRHRRKPYHCQWNTITGSGLYVGYNGNGDHCRHNVQNFQNSRRGSSGDQGTAVSLSNDQFLGV